jgi:MoxR-like ATPase
MHARTAPTPSTLRSTSAPPHAEHVVIALLSHAMTDLDTHRMEAAGTRFVSFFNELGRTFVEREELLAQVALALLSREHVLMTGPPGTAKSGVASAVLRRVIDERTGQPSVFARQFTESTVQTDLVGPINFKTLMETGRTEHFTDEGMLGAVHAFLDEVFDGRDMLLRSTLNVLQERELKQGTKTTRGAIECALMTTNRYLAEVLESSRETLLAFVDRVAFVSFVPKGFATGANLSNVLQKQVGGAGMPRLTEALTIQDLDALQAATESVYVPDEVCNSLATLLGMLDDELGAAERADPQFLATRYLSTRTAVRSGRLLRAVCVYDKLFFNPQRALEVNDGDLKALRLSILLGGPVAESLALLVAREADPRERRQLQIIRTEREIFERCIAKLPPSKTKPRRAKAKEKDAAPKSVKPVAPNEKLTAEELVERAQNAAAAGASLDEIRAVIDELAVRALREGVMASSGEHDSVGKTIGSLVTIAEAVEKVPGDTLSIARWTRGRALFLLDEAVSLIESGSSLARHLLADPAGIDAVTAVANERITHLEKLLAHRKQIRALGAGEEDPARSDTLWLRAASRAEDDVCAILEAGFRKDASLALGARGGDDLATVLGLLAGPLAKLDEIGKRLAALGANGRVKARVVAPRILPLVTTALERVSAPDRAKLLAQVEAVLDVLEEHDLRGALAPRDVLSAIARVLVRVAKGAVLPPMGNLDRDTYRQVRQASSRMAGAYTLLEMAMRVAPQRTLRSTANPEAAIVALHEVARSVSPELAKSVAEIDLQRLDAITTFLERWLAKADGDAGTPEQRLEKLVSSGFFGVAFDEQALLRTALEARVVADVFPDRALEVGKLRARLEALRDRVHAQLDVLVKQRAEEAWAAVLSP